MKHKKKRVKLNYNGNEYDIQINDRVINNLMNDTFENVIKDSMLLAYQKGESFKLDRDIIDIDDIDFQIIDVQSEIHHKEDELEGLRRKMSILEDLQQNLLLVTKPFDQLGF